jgi:hypothetical protein
VIGGESEFEAVHRLIGKPGFGFPRDMCRMIVRISYESRAYDNFHGIDRLADARGRMALPKSNPNAVTEAVAAEVDKMSSEELAALPDLDAGDFQVIGTLIQTFGFMDFNLRRALEVFDKAKLIPKDYQKLYPNLPDAKLTEALGDIIGGMGDDEETKETLLWLQVIDQTRLNRNLVGHFAGKRYNGQDVYVFASKSFKDAKKVFGFGLAEHEVHIRVVSRPGLAESVESAKHAQAWLAKKVPEWHASYSKDDKKS